MILILLLLIAAAVFVLLNMKTVSFVTNCKTLIKSQKVRKGGHAQRPAEPTRSGKTFAGWFYDPDCTERWDFEEDKVEENVTLYAKWI